MPCYPPPTQKGQTWRASSGNFQKLVSSGSGRSSAIPASPTLTRRSPRRLRSSPSPAPRGGRAFAMGDIRLRSSWAPGRPPGPRSQSAPSSLTAGVLPRPAPPRGSRWAAPRNSEARARYTPGPLMPSPIWGIAYISTETDSSRLRLFTSPRTSTSPRLARGSDGAMTGACASPCSRRRGVSHDGGRDGRDLRQARLAGVPMPTP